MKDKNNFQSYLILGTFKTRQEHLNILLKKLNLDISQGSPDMFIIETTAKTKSTKQSNISIDEIRNLKKHIFQKPVSSLFKVIIIKDAHNLTPQAQNAILKILEEPPSHAIIILEAENEFQLLATILSRVIKIKSIPQFSKNAEISFIENSILDNLLSLQTIREPINYLDEQILVLYRKLLTAISAGDIKTQRRIKNTISVCVNSKKMISANVNPKFVFANLFLSFHKQP